MKNFNISRFKSLVKYDIAENGKAYAQALGIAFLSHTLILMLVYYFNRAVAQYNAQTYLEMSLFFSLCVMAVFMILATNVLVVNRYCNVRKGTIYNMLPATYLEKGCLVLLQLFVMAFVVPLLYYIITYSGTYLAMLLLGHAEYVSYAPQVDFWSVYQHLWSVPEGVVLNFDDIMALSTGTIGFTLLPVSFAIGVMIYQIMVTFFNNKRVQIKALFTYFIFSNMVSWTIMLLGFGIIQLGVDGYLYWLEDVIENHRTCIFATLDVLLLSQIAVLAALVWWFFKRLHYKEIR